MTCRFDSCRSHFDKKERCQKHHLIESAIVVTLDTCQLKASVRSVEIRNSEYQKVLALLAAEPARAVKKVFVFLAKEQERDRNESLECLRNEKRLGNVVGMFVVLYVLLIGGWVMLGVDSKRKMSRR